MDVDLDVIMDFDGDLNLNVVSTFDSLNAWMTSELSLKPMYPR